MPIKSFMTAGKVGTTAKVGKHETPDDLPTEDPNLLWLHQCRVHSQ